MTPTIYVVGGRKEIKESTWGLVFTGHQPSATRHLRVTSTLNMFNAQ
jgi:hypothetical protein